MPRIDGLDHENLTDPAYMHRRSRRLSTSSTCIGPLGLPHLSLCIVVLCKERHSASQATDQRSKPQHRPQDCFQAVVSSERKWVCLEQSSCPCLYICCSTAPRWVALVLGALPWPQNGTENTKKRKSHRRESRRALPRLQRHQAMGNRRPLTAYGAASPE